MAKDEPKDLTMEERFLKFQEDQLAFQKKQLEIEGERAKAQQTVAEATAKRLAPKSLNIGEVAQASVFNPRGERSYPMPKLKCEVWAPHKTDQGSHGWTREEVELLNLLEPGTYAFELNDNTPAKMDVIGVTNDISGAIERLTLSPTPPFNGEHHRRFKGMAIMLREMLGEKAAHVLTMKQEKTKIATGELAVSVHG